MNALIAQKKPATAPGVGFAVYCLIVADAAALLESYGIAVTVVLVPPVFAARLIKVQDIEAAVVCVHENPILIIRIVLDALPVIVYTSWGVVVVIADPEVEAMYVGVIADPVGLLDTDKVWSLAITTLRDPADTFCPIDVGSSAINDVSRCAIR
jgi:hypothetical protein